MARCIDADALLAKFSCMELKTRGTRRVDIAFSEGVEWILRHVVPAEINNAPTVDAVEVVRCKDCRYSYTSFQGKERIWCVGTGYFMPCDGFCNCGERKDDGKIH